MSNEWKFIEDAIESVKSMLLKKKDVWTSGQEPFHQFDSMQDMHVTPEQFGLIMANLKMNRVKTVFDRHDAQSDPSGFLYDPDAEDSLIDLASYALLTLGLIYRARDIPIYDPVEEQAEIMKKAEEYIHSPEGKEEIRKLAEEMLTEDAKDKARKEQEERDRMHKAQQEAKKQMRDMMTQIPPYPVGTALPTQIWPQTTYSHGTTVHPAGKSTNMETICQ